MKSLWIPLIICSITITDRTNGQCFDKSTDVDKCQTVSIKCPNGSMIHNPVVVASSMPCDGSKSIGCVGIPVDLAVELNQCYWKETCTINFPSTYIFAETCVQDVRSLHVKSWQCLKKDGTDPDYFVKSICAGNDSIGTASSGILLSHQRIPWDYDEQDFPNSTNTPNLECTKTIHKKIHKKDKILLTMDRFDIDLDNDQLLINNNLIQKLKTENAAYNNKVSIKFIRNQLFSKGGSGFVICYKKIGRREKKTSACDSIMERYTNKAISASESCKNEALHGKCSQKKSEERNVITNSKNTSTSPNINKRCSKCMNKRKQNIDRCNKKCCKNHPIHPKCHKKDNSKVSVSEQKCKLSKKQIKNRCKNCEPSNCIRKKNEKSCLNCCHGKKIAPICKGKKNKNRNKKKKNGKSKN